MDQTVKDMSVESTPIEVFAEDAYLNYAMYVIMDRALPFLGDGLKPVQRRIVYAMSELGLKATAKYKKSARTVGDVLGKFHPHGDTACYEAMVLMAQPFTYRYPLIEGQGNWGSIDDPKSFAAMRYTEARLSPYAEVLLAELEMGTVSWGPNFDGTLKEPLTLPARLPNLLLNGTSGIAVGMATDVPPHNLTEVVSACVHLLENPKANIQEISRHISGPDYPTGAEIITPEADILDIYRSGRGSIRMRATWEKENGDIVVNALPYQVSSSKVIEQIATQMNRKKLPLVADVRDESDHEEPVRLVVTPRSNRVDLEALMLHLFATTDLERTCRVNLNTIGLDRKPRVKGLVEILKDWLQFRQDTVRLRLEHRLEQVLDRLHVLDGLMIAFANLDRIIKIIRESDNPKSALMAEFDLTERQTEAILRLRLRQLARLEEAKLKSEHEDLTAERDKLEKILGSKQRLKTLVKKELLADSRKFGDERRTRIVQRKDAQAIAATDFAPVEAVTVILSAQGWVRVAKGHEVDAKNLNYKAGDHFLAAAHGRSNRQAVFLDSSGRCYTTAVHGLPSARGYGSPLTGLFTMPPNTGFMTVLMGAPQQKILAGSDAGYGFVTSLENLYTRNQKGKAFITLPAGSRPMEPRFIHRDPAELHLVAISQQGRMLVFPLSDLPEMSKGKGNKIINIRPQDLKKGEDSLKIVAFLPESQPLTIFSGKRHFRLTYNNIRDFMGNRGLRGKKLSRGFQNVDRVEIGDPQDVHSGEAPAETSDR